MTRTPLKPLHAFEATARTGSLAAAARELKVTSAAVSQQVKLLEQYWGRSLFLRQGNRLSLTEAGQTAYPPLANALAAISALNERMQGISRRARFVLSAPHSVAETWLPLQLAAWIRDGGDRQLDLRIEDDPVEFSRDRIHMRIFHGHLLYTDFRTEILFHDRIVAIATPAFIACHGASVLELPDEVLVHTDWGSEYATGPDWSDVLSGQRVIDAGAGLRVPASSAAIQCALAGLGVALVPEMMATHHLDAGRLQRVQSPERWMKRPYTVAYPHAIAGWSIVNSLLEHFKRPHEDFKRRPPSSALGDESHSNAGASKV